MKNEHFRYVLLVWLACSVVMVLRLGALSESSLLMGVVVHLNTWEQEGDGAVDTWEQERDEAVAVFANETLHHSGEYEKGSEVTAWPLESRAMPSAPEYTSSSSVQLNLQEPKSTETDKWAWAVGELHSCNMGVTPFEGRTAEEQLQMHVRMARTGGCTVHRHIRRTGGGELQQMMRRMGYIEKQRLWMELEPGAFYPAEAFDSSNALNKWARNSDVGLMFIGGIRDPVERFISDYSWRGPFSGRAFIWNPPRRLAPETPEAWRYWIEKSPSKYCGVSAVGSQAFYLRNFECVMLGVCTTLLKRMQWPRSQGQMFQKDSTTAHQGTHLKTYAMPCISGQGDSLYSELLENAKRSVVSFDMVIPTEEMGNAVPFLDYLSALEGRPQGLYSSTLTPQHTTKNKFACPEDIRGLMRAENSEDAELYSFTKKVYQCKAAVYEELLHYVLATNDTITPAPQGVTEKQRRTLTMDPNMWRGFKPTNHQ